MLLPLLLNNVLDTFGGGLSTTFFYKRTTNIFISKESFDNANATNTVQLSVKDFSYNRRSSSVNIGRETLDPTQARIVKPTVTVVAPVEFNLTTYVLPLVDSNSPGYVTSPEEYLWVSLLGADSLTSNSTSSTIDFEDGNVGTLQNLTLWFNQTDKFDGNYRLENAVIDSATINFDINGIAEVQWKGSALDITSVTLPPAATDRTLETGYIKNRVSPISLTMDTVSYNLALTGGNIRFDNKNSYYGRTRLGETTVTTGHFTGNREVSGSIELYVKADTDSSVGLFDAIKDNIENNNYEATHLANITIDLGGATAPNLQLNIPQAILNMGNQSFDELYRVSIPFTAQEETGDYCSVVYQMP
jgi:hypothetical protein